MRMRERPCSVARLTGTASYPPLEQCDKRDHYNTQLGPLKSLGEQQCRPYTRCSRTDSHDSGLNLCSIKSNNNNDRNVLCINSVDETGRCSKIFRNNLSSEIHGLRKYSSQQLLVNGTPSSSALRQLSYQTLTPFYPLCVMTRDISPLPSKLADSNIRSNNVWTRKAQDIANNSRDLNNYTAHWNFSNAKPNPKIIKKTNHRTNTKDIIKNGIKNSYRNIDENFVDLTSESKILDIGSGVTFTQSTNDDKNSIAHDQIAFASAAYHRMSTPDLPPITTSATHRGDKRKISTNSVNSAGSKISISQPASSVNSKTNYSRRSSTTTAESCANGIATIGDERITKKTFPIRKNHSDSSLSNLQASGSNHSKESGSVITTYTTPQSKDTRGGSSSRGRVEEKNGAVRDMKYLANGQRTLSWCATDLASSKGKLETLFEGQNRSTGNITNRINKFSITNSHKNSVTHVSNNMGGKDTYSQDGITVKETNNRNIISDISCNSGRHSNTNNTGDVPSIARLSRPVSVNGIRNPEVVSRHSKTPNRRLIDEDCDSIDGSTIDAFINKGRILRSNSENKLNGKSTYHYADNTPRITRHQKQATPRSVSRNMSVDRTEQLRSKSQQRSKGVTSYRTPNGDNVRIRRFRSMSNLYSRHTRETLNDITHSEEIYYTEDSIEANDRLVAWLNVVNNIDKYDTDPKDDVIDYSDEPPQTDTAIHLVYEGK